MQENDLFAKMSSDGSDSTKNKEAEDPPLFTTYLYPIPLFYPSVFPSAIPHRN